MPPSPRSPQSPSRSASAALLTALVIACASGGALLSCAEVDNGSCGDGVLQAGEECDGDDLNGLDCMAIGREPGELACGVRCHLDYSGCGGCLDPCPNAGDQRCKSELVQTCDWGPTGCLTWLETTDCASASQICDDRLGTPQCVAP